MSTTDLEQKMALLLAGESLTPVEFEEFWREYDRLIHLVLEWIAEIGRIRIFTTEKGGTMAKKITKKKIVKKKLKKSRK